MEKYVHLQAQSRLLIWLLDNFSRYKFHDLQNLIRIFSLRDKIANYSVDALNICNREMIKLTQYHILIKQKAVHWEEGEVTCEL